METKKGVIITLILVLLLGFILLPSSAKGEEVTYDGRSLIINGTRRILFSGSIHYPRSTPQMWPTLITRAKQGGIEVIQTYVFWNVHEPVQGQYKFEGRYDLVGFIKEVQAQGLYVSLRIGPFIESEWNYGGFPFWLHDVPGIVFRSDNEPFKYHMERYASKIVDMMKSEGLYASQGGPIILTQIENEYRNVEPAFHEKGPPYVRWAAAMAVGLKTGVPWMMCKQNDAPDPVINTCNGMNCGETFVGPNSPTKPALWTENWTSFIQVYGGEPYIRSAEDIAFAVALFVAAMKGSFVNYYMYHGGTNFGRFASSYIITSYYDQAPLDEYGFLHQPKWGHLRELHAAIKLCSETLLHGTYNKLLLGKLQEGHVFQDISGNCVIFLANKDKNKNAAVQFRNTIYELPARSISILPDCKIVVFNTAKVTAQHGMRSTSIVQELSHQQEWEGFMDEIPNNDKTEFSANALINQMNTTKDETDYCWYSVSYETTGELDDQHILHVDSSAHLVHAFVNNVYLGSSHGNSSTRSIALKKDMFLKDGINNISLLSVMVGLPNSGAYLERRDTGIKKVTIYSSMYGSLDITKHQWRYKTTGELDDQHILHVDSSAHLVHAFVNNVYLGSSHGNSSTRSIALKKDMFLKDGINNISLLSVMVGLPNSGAYLERRDTGIKKVTIYSSMYGSLDITKHQWRYKIGLLGENLKIYTQDGSSKVVWGVVENASHLPLMWYKTTFDAPSGSSPVVLNLASMGKGEAWINGESIGRYWVSFSTPKGQPSQTLYHVPLSFLKPSGNLLVIFEEMGGDPLKISLETVSVSTVCGLVSESHPPSLFARQGHPTVELQCHARKTISVINFASYGTPVGDCENHAIGGCHSAASNDVIDKICLGKRRCSIGVRPEQFGEDPCPNLSKSLLVSASCH